MGDPLALIKYRGFQEYKDPFLKGKIHISSLPKEIIRSNGFEKSPLQRYIVVTNEKLAYGEMMPVQRENVLSLAYVTHTIESIEWEDDYLSIVAKILRGTPQGNSLYLISNKFVLHQENLPLRFHINYYKGDIISINIKIIT
jgi:hypothetical protein